MIYVQQPKSEETQLKWLSKTSGFVFSIVFSNREYAKRVRAFRGYVVNH